MREKKEKERIQGTNSGKSGVEKPHHNTVASNQGIIAHSLNCPMWNPVKKDTFFAVVSV